MTAVAKTKPTKVWKLKAPAGELLTLKLASLVKDYMIKGAMVDTGNPKVVHYRAADGTAVVLRDQDNSTVAYSWVVIIDGARDEAHQVAVLEEILQAVQVEHGLTIEALQNYRQPHRIAQLAEKRKQEAAAPKIEKAVAKRKAKAKDTTPEWEMPAAGSFVVPDGAFNAAMRQMNERWAVVTIGGKTRYARMNEDRHADFFDKTNITNLFEATTYEVVSKDQFGNVKSVAHCPLLPEWLGWNERTQYAGYGFYPNGKAPHGHYNIWRGLAVVPKKGSWRRLKRHLWENVCKRDPERFRWLMGWLAQLFQHPEIKPGTHLVLTGGEGVGKSKLGEWIIRALKPCAMTITAGERLTGRFNAHFESLLFAMAEEVFWAGDKQAEGVIKSLATANEMDYERKGLDPIPGLNYTRLLICSNNPWVVPAWSGGRRWCVYEVGDEHQRDYAYFAAIDAEMENGGLEAMLYDLLHSPLADSVNVRQVPITEELLEQRRMSQDNKQVWWSEVIEDGGFHIWGEDYPLDEDRLAAVPRDVVFESAKDFFARSGKPATKEEVSRWLHRELGDLFNPNGPRLGDGKTKPRRRTWEFGPLSAIRALWEARYGKALAAIEAE